LLRNLNGLEKIHLPVATECDGIRAQPAFINLYEVNLSGCSNLVDVSSLRGVYKANLSFCNSLYDISPLGFVHTLIIDGCNSITDLSSLHSVSFDLEIGCTSLKYLSMERCLIKGIYLLETKKNDIKLTMIDCCPAIVYTLIKVRDSYSIRNPFNK
jgi:hypothetical protein